jgi:membrane-associated protease RseP (regulator of RpoE activity)
LKQKSHDNSSEDIIGIDRSAGYLPNRFGLDQYTGVHLYWTLFWICLLGINVAIVNMLPAFPFNGEKMLYYPLASLVKKRKNEIRWALNIFR